MAEYRLYLIDAAARRYGSTSDSGNTGTHAFAVDVDQDTPWLPGAGTNVWWQMDLGAAYQIGALGLGNHNLSGLQVALSYGSNPAGPFSDLINWTAVGTNSDLLLTLDTSATARYWRFYINSPTASTRIGTISLLLQYGRALLTGDMSPIGQIGVPLQPRLAIDQGPTGKEMRQVLGAVGRGVVLELHHGMISDTTDGWGLLETLLLDWHKWVDGVWVVDDLYHVTNHPNALYCQLQGAVPAAVAGPAGRVRGSLTLMTISRWAS